MMVDPVIDLLKKVHALYTDDHFVYTSGKHGSVYVNKDAIFQHPQQTTLICRMTAERYQDYDIDAVVGPAIGGIVLSQWTAYHLTQLKGKEVLGLYTEKDAQKNQVFTRGYDELVKNRKVLIVEDTTTTGGSVKKVIDTVRSTGGKVIAVCVMVNRDPINVTSEFIGAPFSALCELPTESYDAKECPFCLQGRPVNTQIGHGKKYLSLAAT
jgi:orotate phosphoribosyltransferase